MIKFICLFFSLFFLLHSVPSAYSSTCNQCSPPAPSNTSPGGGNPDDTFAVDSGFFREGISPLNSDPSVVTFQNGFAEEFRSFAEAYKKVEIKTNAASTAFQLINSTPLLVIPSGGLYGYENSAIFKATLNEYVIQGGTLIVLSQKHGYDYASIPTPDGRPITGYGWEEDQNCFADSVAIESWHKMLSGQSRSTPTLNVDGYFTGYPANSTILLRRTANGQPALLMYEHGLGRVIVTSMYSDWAYGHGQASQEEIALIRDMLSWAKKPAVLPEVKPGESISVPVTLTNSTATDAASIKLQIWNPDRSTLLLEQSVSTSIPAGQAAINNVSWQAPSNAALGIHHIDYLLLDATGNIIQPQAETDSGRFVVSNPPQVGTLNKDIWLSITSPNQEVFFNEPFAYTFHIYNNTATTRNLTLKSFLPHTNRWHEWPVTATANGETVINGSDLFIDSYWMFETLRAYLYDETGAQIGSYMLSFKGVYPAVTVTTAPGKPLYTRGETVDLGVSLGNSRSMATTVKLKVTVTDPANSSVFSTAADVLLPAGGREVRSFTFPLPQNAQGGVYAVSSEVLDVSGKKIGGDTATFTVPLRLVTLTPNYPASWQAGANPLAFSLTNLGTLPVTSGVLVASLIAPDGTAIGPLTQPFTLDAGQSKNVDFSFSVPPLKFGSYTLTYTQSDETKAGKSATVNLPNSAVIAASFDKPSYRIREAANLSLTLTNSGRFNMDGVSVTVSVPDTGYTDTKTLVVAPGQTLSLQQAITIPDTIAVGQHAVTVTLTLPGGSAITREFTITVPDSLLSYSLAQSSAIAGGTVTPVITNSGGKDTTADYRLTLYDAKSAQIADQSATGSVQAGGTLPLSLPIPLGATDGVYTLVATYRNTITGQAATAQKLLSISGIRGALSLRSDKPSYLNTESIAGLSTITNSGTPLQGGNLHLQVTTAAGSQKQKTWTSQFDFQQGARDGVDTYGVNDWIIPDDDFDGVVLNTDRWAPGKYDYATASWATGDISTYVSIKDGKLLLNSPAYTESQVFSKWQLDGDFDIQVDFSNNNSVQGEGAEIGVHLGDYKALIKNAKAMGYFSGVHSLIDGHFLVSKSTGAYKYAASGSFRITKAGKTVITYYKEGSNWIEHFRYTLPQLGDHGYVTILLFAGPGYPVTAEYDNFKVNSGRIKTENQSVDSVRLMPLNDNFDNGVINSDRWITSGTVSEQSGKLSIDNTNQESFAESKSQLEGDFDLQVQFDSNNSVQFQGAEFGVRIGTSWITIKNTASDNSYFSGIWLNNIQYGSNRAGQFASSGIFRIIRQASTISTYYWSGTSWVEVYRGNFPGFSAPATAKLWIWRGGGYSGAKTSFDKFKILGSGTYLTVGKISLKQDGGQVANWQSLTWNSTQPVGTAIKLRTRTAASEAALTSATWSDYLTASGSPITSPQGRWIEVEATLSTTDTNITPLLHDVTVNYGNNPGDILWQADVPVNLAQGAISDLNNAIGTIGSAGKYYLQGALTSSTGQSVATAEYPFFVAQGNTLLSFTSDKRLYKPGETVTISGEVKNLTTVEAANLNFNIKGKPASGTEQTLYSATFTLAAGESRPFTITTTAGIEGAVALTGTVTQNASTLAEIADQYEVTSPRVTATVAAADIVGNDPFALNLTLTNLGKTDAQVTVLPSITSLPEAVTIPAGQTKLLQFSQQIAADTTDSFTISGDLTQVITKTIKYGPAVTLAAAPEALYPEGKVSLPVTVTNSGLLDSQYSIDYQLSRGATTISQQTKSYFLAKGSSSADTLSFDLAEGNYQLAATGQKPAAAATAAFQVRKEIKAELTLAVGAQSSNLLPATVTVTNLGYNPIDGTVRLSLVDASGAVAWNSAQDVSLSSSPVPRSSFLQFAINLAPLKPGSYTVKAELLDGGNRQLAAQAAPFSLLGPTIAISQLPQYRIIPAGGSSDFTFKVKNSGNQEGAFDLTFKADDLTNVTRSEWLKAGEEKEVVFALQTAADLEEKDYFASYSLKQQGSGSGTQTGLKEQGTVKYHLQGLNLAVTATLDRQAYSPGDTATLTLNVTQQDGGAPPNLFARVNYNGYNEKQSFTLSGSQTLVFTVPLTQISGEKLFYGIYAESGRSIHLNTIYVYKADGALAISTDKQVYNPGETVNVSLTGTAMGELTLTAPGEFSTTFAFSGADTRSFVLPATMTAGTYTVNAQLKTQNPELITVSHPFDVAGIQVKVKEALLDKTKYVPTDTMQLTLTIESNRDIPATVKTWVVDPAGNYTEAGSGDAALTATAPLLTTLNAQLATASLGIHKLVYGIYQGDLLLASGAKAFDIGDAVLLSIATDRSDYPEITLPVNVKIDMYGTVAAGIELFLDDISVKTDNVALSGMASNDYSIPPASVTAGLHTLKAVLSAGGLTSSRELRFTYGSSLPDLTGRIAAQSLAGGTMNLLLTVTNQGKSTAAASRAALYDGDPASGGQLVSTLDIPSISAGSSVSLPFDWNVLGKSGEQVLYGIVDSDNSIAEFIEGNNTAVTAISLPVLSLAATTGKSAYGANEDAAITVSIANLAADTPLESCILKIRLTSASGTVIDLPDKEVMTITPATMTNLYTVWNTTISVPSTYTLTARLVSVETELATASSAFTITPKTALTGSIAPDMADVPQESSVTALFTINNNGNIPVDGVLQGVIRDTQSGIDKDLQEIPLQLLLAATKTGTFSFSLAGLPIKSYDLLLNFVSPQGEIAIARAQFAIIDTTPPDMTISTLADGSYTNQETLNVSGTVQDNSGAAQIVINSVSVPVAADGTFSQALVLNMPDNLIEVKAMDLANNSVYDTRTIHLDQAVPSFTITSPADNSKTSISPVEVKGWVGETATITVKVKDNLQTATMNGNDFSATVLPLPGWNTIEITATDLAGNPGSQKRSVLFNDQAPSLAVTEPSQDSRTNRSSVTVTGSASDPYTAVGITVAMEGAILTPPVVDGIFSQIVTFTEEKLYPIIVTATNEVGTRTTTQRNVIFDKTPPNLTIDPVVTPTNSAGQLVTGTREEATEIMLSCATATVGTITYPTGASWQSRVEGLTQGGNLLLAESTDLASNRTTATATILYVPRAPEVTINVSPTQLWPPNKSIVPVVLDGNVRTFGSDIREVTISIADEYGTCNQQGLRFGDTVLLEAWREGNDPDGRIYTITAVATDQAGNRTTRSTTVVVPHDMGK